MLDTSETKLSIEDFPAPQRHHLLKVGPLSFYWIWINEGSDHQRRCWILNWRSRSRLIHLHHWTWWKPIKQFPSAMRASLQITKQKS